MPLSRRSALARLLSPALPLIASRQLLAESPPPVVDSAIRAAAGRVRLGQLFTGSTAADCRTWQQRFRHTLNRLLGESQPPRSWTVSEERKSREPDHYRYELLLRAKHVDPVPLYLLVPRGTTSRAPRPAVVCVHGHGAHGHHPVAGRSDLEGVSEAIKRAHYDYGLQFVRRGYIVAAPCLIPFGRRVNKPGYGNTDPCATTFVRMQALGRLPITANLRDLRWTISLLAGREDVDEQRIGCAGLSYGGRMTMLVSAIDERVRVAAISGALNLLQERIMHRYSCGSQIIPGLLEHGDYPEIGSLIAPRPAVWETGSTDGLIVPGWDEKFRGRLRRAYSALGAVDQLHFDGFTGGHRWNGQVAYPLFDDVLKG